jgi:hypothetical protein
MPVLLKDADSDLADDLLGHRAAGTTLVRALRGLRPPGCVALYGSWGIGKTTFLRRTQRRWRDEKAGPTVWFDPWEHERRDDVLSPLLHAITTTVLGDDRVDRARIKQLLAGILKTVLSLSIRAGSAFLFGGAASAPLKSMDALAGLAPEDFEKHMEGWKRYHDEIKEAKTAFKQLVDLALVDQPPENRMVVFLDDLDRCLPDNVVALVEGVKLLLCGDTGCRALFVFALDRQIVGEAIRQRFPGATLYTGENYLEKIFDLALEVPPATLDRVHDFLTNRCADNPGLARRIEECFATREMNGIAFAAQVFSESIFSNPRVLTRVLNRLALLLADDERAKSIQRVANGWAFRRLLVWLAGAERFPAFRQLFLTATVPELELLHLVAKGREAPTPGPSISAIAALPGFHRYYELLELADTPGGDLDGERKHTDGLQTIRDVDSLLRSVGL